ncbi:MAG: TonB-dependent receptor [Balneolaceae bacterium]
MHSFRPVWQGAACSLLLSTFLWSEIPARPLHSSIQTPLASDTTDTSILQGEMEDLIIQSTRLPLPSRQQPIHVETIHLDHWERLSTNHLGDLLEEMSSLTVRDHGPGSMALLSQRGLSSGQTQVLWEGFPIRSLSLNQTDLSLLSAPLFSSLEVSPGTPSSIWGGGALGGSLHLRSRATRVNRPEVMAGLHAGAFANRGGTLSAVLPRGNHRFQFRGFHRQASNDFAYRDPLTDDSEKRVHNAGEESQLLAGWSHGNLTSKIWVWDREEEIPGSILQQGEEAIQVDRGFRWTGSTRIPLQDWHLSPAAYLEQYTFHYDRADNSIHSRIQTRRLLTSLDIERPTSGTIQWRGGVEAGHEEITTNNYTQSPIRRTLAARIHPQITMINERLLWTPAVRLDHYSDSGWVWSPSIGSNLELIPERLHLRGSVSRNFNPPSFNDLYWTPGGNPDLKAERGVTLEGGIHWEPTLNGLNRITVTVYRIRLRNGIYWTPRQGSVWSPENVERIHAHGLETRIGGSVDAPSVTLSWGAAADLRHSRIGRPRFSGDQAIDRQMRYIPLWSIRSHLEAHFQSWNSRLSWRWTDRRYTTADHSSWLDPFHRVDLRLSRGGTLTGRPWRLTAELRNLLDSRYEMTPWYPMPGRHLQFSLRIGLFES